MRLVKPPRGAIPLHLWLEIAPDDTLMMHLARYMHVLQAVERYREVGRQPPREWLEELGVL
jgi:hypothetical protein